MRWKDLVLAITTLRDTKSIGRKTSELEPVQKRVEARPLLAIGCRKPKPLWPRIWKKYFRNVENPIVTLARMEVTFRPFRPVILILKQKSPFFDHHLSCRAFPYAHAMPHAGPLPCIYNRPDSSFCFPFLKKNFAILRDTILSGSPACFSVKCRDRAQDQF